MNSLQISEDQLIEIIEYWINCPRTTGFHHEENLIYFLKFFSRDQIMGAMYMTTSKFRENYFKYLCDILNYWKRQLDEGIEPKYFIINLN